MEKKSCLIESQDAVRRLDIFLRERETQFSRTQIKELILKGGVLVNGCVVKPRYKLKVGDQVCWSIPDVTQSGLAAEDIPIDIVFEDSDIIILNKAAGMVVHPGAGNKTHTLVNALLFHTRNLSTVNALRPGIVHRLDKDTSGLMVVAKNNASHFKLAKQFRKHTIQRRYIALVSGHVEFDEGVVDLPIKRHTLDRKKMTVSYTQEARPAYTFYRVLKRFTPLEHTLTGFTALELFPKTGRTHQLRVHLSYLGHPVLGDVVYGKKDFSRLALHAKDLGVTHPSTGEFMKFASPLPAEMAAVLA